MIDEIEKRHGNALAVAAAVDCETERQMMDEIDVRNCPILSFFGTDDAPCVADVAEAFRAVGLRLRSCDKMLRMVAFVRLDDGEDIQIGAVQFQPRRREIAVVATDELRRETIADEAVVTSAPVVSKPTGAVEMADMMVAVVACGAFVVVAVLLMEGEQIALLMAFFIDGFYAFRPACGFADGNGIGLEGIIAPEAPSVQMHVCVSQAVVVQLAELRDDVLRRQILVVVFRLFLIKGACVRLIPIQDACVDDRAADHFRDFRRPRDLLPQRHEMARHLRMFAIGLRHCHVVSFRERLDADAPRIAEFPKLRNETCFQMRRAACRMMEHDAEIVMRLNDHHGRGAMVFDAPPRHRQDACIGQEDVGFRIERVRITDDFTRPVLRNQHPLHERQDGRLDAVV